MARRKSIIGVLDGFLGAYLSRYNDFEGYWIFGQLANTCDPQLTISLTAQERDSFPTVTESALHCRLRFCAKELFCEQLGKHGIPTSWIGEASLNLRRGTESQPIAVNQVNKAAQEWSFSACARTDLGKLFVRERKLLIAPHDPSVEIRSARSTTDFARRRNPDA